jgi:acyl-homoserine lactone acylase PvdQ
MLVGATLAVLALPGPAAGQVQSYRHNDGGGFLNILPPGQNGFAGALDIGGFLASCPPTGTSNCPDARRPPHSGDQLAPYGDLVYSTPGLKQSDLGRFFKDASFGVRAGDTGRTYSPRSDVTIVRDRSAGVPHIYGRTREGALFGAGYAGTEDRLFVMDVLRNAGRGRLSSFAGGAEGNREMDREQWQIAPYTEADLQRQYDQADELYGEEGRAVQRDVDAYVAGINRYIAEAKADPLNKLPGEYAAILKPEGPDPWKVTDVIATASLIGGIFGKGGGRELDSALLYQRVLDRFGRRRGDGVFGDLRSAEDREAPTTVRGKSFPYQRPPRRVARGSLALPDRGSLRRTPAVAGGSGAGSASRSRGLAGGLLGFPSGASNALLVSGRESRSGRPLAVMGPQTGYFAPQLLSEMDLHGPGLDARGVAFAGVSLYVLLGRGRDYAWSATSASQDIVDTFAVDLCEPGGGRPSLSSNHYVFRGRCLAMETLERRNAWVPTPADQTPPGSETLRTQRTKIGLVTARATVGGTPVAYTSLRSTYFHEADSARAFSEFNDPARIRGPRDYQRAASKINFTFNWFYADPQDIAYFNSGDNPVRARNVSQHFPTRARFEWRGYDPERNISRRTRFSEHPQAVNQGFLTSWNNKPAPGYRAADDNYAYGSVYRSEPLDDRIIKGTRGRRKMTLPQLVDAAQTAGNVDLRADKVLAFALRILGRQRDPELAGAIRELRAWRRSGNLRKDADRDQVYEHSEAIRILDAWWPLWMRAQFEPTLGPQLFRSLEGIRDQDNEPNNHGAHLGSAYNGGWYHYAEKDLRTILSRIPERGRARRRALASGVVAFGSGRRDVRGLGPNAFVPRRARYSRVYCGGSGASNGTLQRCRRLLASSLKAALRVNRAELYEDEVCADYGRPNDQWCFDTIRQRPIGAIQHPLIHWVNRPTFQQALEIESRAPR